MNSKRIDILVMTFLLGVLVALTAGCGGGGGGGGGAGGTSGYDSPSITSLGYTLTGKVILPDGSSGAGILVAASKVGDSGVTNKQAKVLAAGPTGPNEFKKAVKSASENGGSYITMTDVEGIYILSGLDTGTYYIEASRGGLKATSSATVTPYEAAVVDLSLTPTGSLSGICELEAVGADGYAGTFVVIKGTDYIGFTADDGSFTINQIPVDSYQVSFTHPGYESYDYPQSVSIPVADDYTLPQIVTLVSLRGGTVIGTVTAQDTEPVEGALVRVGDLNLYAETDADGRYRLDDVPPGTYTVYFKHDLVEESAEVTENEIEKRQETTVDAELTDNKPPVWESATGVVYVYNLTENGGGVTTNSVTSLGVGVEFGRAFDASRPLTYVVYQNRVQDWDTEEWENNYPVEVSELDLEPGMRGESGTIIEGLDPGERYVFGVRVKDRHGNLEYNRSEYLSVPDDGTVTVEERLNLLASMGAIGIGTSDPQGLFHVQPEEGGSPFVIDNQTGYVGIGTTDPHAALTVGSTGQPIIQGAGDGTFSVDSAGIVISGTWQGDPVADQYIGSVSGAKVTGDIAGNAANVNSVVGVAHGGTGATAAGDARDNLGLGELAVFDTVSGGAEGLIDDGTISGDDLATGAVSGLHIADGTITDADINAAAAIAGTKIGPDFGSQDIVTMGNVGIGTTLPGATVEVVGTVKATHFIGDGSLLTGVADAGGVVNNGTTGIEADNDADGAGFIVFKTAKTNRLIITNDGQVGIGTDVPSSQLTVIGTVEAEAFLFGTTDVETEFASMQSDLGSLEQASAARSSNLSDLTDAAAARTNLGLIAGGDGDVWVEKAGDTMTDRLTLPADGLVAGTDQLVLSGGMVGVGTSSPSVKLDVAGGIRASDGLTVTGTVSLPESSITDAMISDTLTASDLVSGSSVVSDAEVDDDITLTSITQVTNRSILDTTATLTVERGGTDAVTAAEARTNLGLIAGGEGDIWVEKAGDTMTGTLTISGADTDLTTGADEHLSLMPGGTGNVGVGTTLPGVKLDVTGGIRASDGLTITGSVSLPDSSVTDAMVSDTLTASDLVSGSSVVSDSEVDDTITLTSLTQVVSRPITDTTGTLPVARGGTGATSSQDARVSLGVDVGTNVQAYDDGLQSIAGLTTSADQIIYTTGPDTYQATTLTAAGRSLLDDESVIQQHITLGLGTMSAQYPDDVRISGGTIDGVAIGGTNPEAGTFLSVSTDSVTERTTAAGVTVDGVLLKDATLTGTLIAPTDGLVVGTNQLILSGGRVGIGTTSPALTMHAVEENVATDSSTSMLRLTHTTDGTPAAGIGSGLEFEAEDAAGTTVAALVEGILTDVTDGAETGTLIFKTADSADDGLAERLRIDNDGNVGIGTASPTEVLDVAGRIRATHFIGSGSYLTGIGSAGGVANKESTTVAADAPVEDPPGSGTIAEPDGIGDIVFQTAGETRVFVGNNGQIGIGTIEPAAQLEVIGGIKASDGLTVTGTVSLPADSITDAMVSDTLTASDLVAVSSVVADAEVDDDITLTNITQITNRSILDTTATLTLARGGTGATTAADARTNLGLIAGSDGDIWVEKAGDTMTGTLTLSSVVTDITTGTNEHLALMPNGTGKVGIGTTNPSSIFHIYGDNPKLSIDDSTDMNPALYLSKSGSPKAAMDLAASTSNLRFLTYDGSWHERITVKQDGNVGIGSTTPGEKLHVNGNIQADKIYFGSSGSAPFIDASGATLQLRRPDGVDGADVTAQYLTLNSGKLTSLDYGALLNVLQLEGTAGVTITGTTDTFVVAERYLNVKNYDESKYQGLIASHATLLPNINSYPALVIRGQSAQTADLFQWQNNSETVLGVIDSSGNVGIATADPTQKLDVTGTVKATAFSGPINPNLTDGSVFFQGTSGLTEDNSNLFWDDTNNRLGIGTTAPSLALTVNGDMEVGTSRSDYQHLRLGGGNSFGFLYGHFGTLGDGIHMGYNYYVNSTGTNTIADTPYATSRISMKPGEISLATGAVNTIPSDRMTVDISGNVGIGTTAPGTLLHIKHTGDTTKEIAHFLAPDHATDGQLSNIVIGKDTSAGNGAIFGYRYDITPGDEGAFIQVYGDSGPETGLFIKKGGNVGIGTTAPNEKLQIHESTSGNSRIRFTNSTTGSGSVEGCLIGLDETEDLEIRQVGAGQVQLFTNNTQRLTITASGNVGIGSNVPTQKLDVVGTVIATAFSGPINPNLTAGSVVFQGGSGLAQDNTNLFWDDTNNRLGIGTTSPTSPLHVRANAGWILVESTSGVNGANVQIRGGGASENWKIDAQPNAGGNPQDFTLRYGNSHVLIASDTGDVWAGGILADSAPVLTVKSTGNVGIGTASPGQKLDVVGNIAVSGTVDGRDVATDGSKLDGITAAAADTSNDSWTGTGTVYTTSGNVGIGTTGPTYKLDVTGNTRLNTDAENILTLRRSFNDWTLSLGLMSNGSYDSRGFVDGNYSLELGNRTIDGSYPDYGVIFSTLGIQRWYVSNSGYFKAWTDNSYDIGASGSNRPRNLYLGSNALISGNVGIGTASPGQKLDVVGNIAVSGTVDSRDVAADGSKLDGITATAADTSNDSWTGTGNVYTTSGNVGIGTTSPGAKLHVNGDINQSGYVTEVFTGSLTTNQEVYIDLATLASHGHNFFEVKGVVGSVNSGSFAYSRHLMLDWHRLWTNPPISAVITDNSATIGGSTAYINTVASGADLIQLYLKGDGSEITYYRIIVSYLLK